MAARAGSAAAGAAGSRGAVPPGDRTVDRDVAGRVRRHRPRSGDDPQADGEAAHQGRGAPARRAAARADASADADRAAGREVARTARGPDAFREPRGRGERGNPLAQRRAGSAERAIAVDAPRAGAGGGGPAAQRAVPAGRPSLLRLTTESLLGLKALPFEVGVPVQAVLIEAKETPRPLVVHAPGADGRLDIRAQLRHQ